MSRERVLDEAIALADTHGIVAVTMRGLAAEIGVEAMSLYHHVPGKVALLDGLVEVVVGEIELATSRLGDPGHRDWRTEVWQRCLSAREVMLRHPWAPELIGSRTTIPPSVYGHYEAILATLIEGGFSYHLGHRAMHALGAMALGFVPELFSPASPGDADEMTEAELSELADALPHMAAMVASESHGNDEGTLGWCDSQAEFEFTLDLLLDGLARALDRESPHARGAEEATSCSRGQGGRGGFRPP